MLYFLILIFLIIFAPEIIVLALTYVFVGLATIFVLLVDLIKHIFKK